MCGFTVLQVKRLAGNVACMSDGRNVRLDPLHKITVGDYLEIYADVAVGKVNKSEAETIQKARQKKG